VQAAITAAKAADTIHICPRTYNETIAINKNLTLIGAGSGTGLGASVLNGGGNGHVVTVNLDKFLQPGVTVELQNIRIIGGSVTGGFGDGDGGGIYNNAGFLTMTDCVVFDNSASRGGGIFNSDGTVSLTDCVVLENSATGDGGGIYTDQGSVTLNDSQVTDNTAIGNGGGIYSNLGNVTLSGTSSVTGNSSPQCVGTTC